MQVWLNGSMIDAAKARISPFDRGFLFGDGLYEVVRYFNGRPVALEGHVARMKAGVNAIGINGFGAGDLEAIGDQLVQSEELPDALFYLQVTRGTEPDQRNHTALTRIEPTIFGFVAAAEPLGELKHPQAVTCITTPDERWRRCEIKSINLLANVLGGMEATRHDAHEALLHRGGYVSEGTRSNVFAVVNGWVVTPPVNAEPSILHGVTRAMTIDAAKACGQRVDERFLRLEELRDANEVFITSTRRIVSAVSHLDHHPVGNQQIGPVTQQVFGLLRKQIAAECGVKLAEPLHV